MDKDNAWFCQTVSSGSYEPHLLNYSFVWVMQNLEMVFALGGVDLEEDSEL